MGLRSSMTTTGGELRAIARASTPTHRHLRDRLFVLLWATAGVDLICALLAWWFEHGGPQTQVTNFGTALFWSSTQLASVSSSYANPVSTAGDVLDVLMEIYAITVIAALAGSLGSFFHRRSKERDEAERAAKAALDL
jgi:hypothetical protein